MLKAMVLTLIIGLAFSIVIAFGIAKTVEAASPAMAAQPGATGGGEAPWALYIAIGISIAVGCISSGYAVAKVGSAAMGAVSENPDLFGRAIVFVGLAEGIAIYGLIVAIMLYGKI